jgi:iron complex transport system substrate-binding protein
MSDVRIISFLPAATEMACALGMEEQLVGVSHECDFPASVRSKEVVVRCSLPTETMTLAEIDVAVAERVRSGQSLYEVDQAVVERLAPTHILSQALCVVCAPSSGEVARALKLLPSEPHILWFTPHCIEDIFENLRELGADTGHSAAAEELISAARARLRRIAETTIKAARRPRVLCLEWTDPYYCCGHWVPEMVEIAGGQDVLGRKGVDSVRIQWSEIAALSPEILVVSPCGFRLAKAVEQTKQLLQKPGWNGLPAVRNGRVFAVDANAYFARPGPRVVKGVELLAHLFHPELCDWEGPDGAFQRVT